MAKNIPFPIRTDTSCLLKWNWSTIWITHGKTNSCHRNWKVPLPLEDFDNFHNLPYKIGHRESMLRGEWPHSPEHKGCYYCKEIEDSGGQSDRQFMTETQLDQTPDELVDNPTATHVSPAVLEVFLNRTCNMACTYCSRHYSSKIATEADKFNNPDFDNQYFGVEEDLKSEHEKEQYNVALLNWLAKNGTCLKRLHILGGEPFFQPEFDDYIDVWKNHPNPDLIFNVVSNFNVSEKRFINKIDAIMELVRTNKISRLDLTASIDCWGPEQEYVRRGFKCNRTENNIRYVLQFPEIRLNFNPTYTVMSLGDTFIELLKKKKQWESETGHPSITLYGGIVSSKHADPRMLGGDFYKETFAKIRKTHPVETWDDRQAYKNLNGLLNVIEQSQPDITGMKHFLTVYNELDRRHGTNWRETFPKIAHEIDKHIIL